MTTPAPFLALTCRRGSTACTAPGPRGPGRRAKDPRRINGTSGWRLKSNQPGTPSRGSRAPRQCGHRAAASGRGPRRPSCLRTVAGARRLGRRPAPSSGPRRPSHRQAVTNPRRSGRRAAAAGAVPRRPNRRRSTARSRERLLGRNTSARTPPPGRGSPLVAPVAAEEEGPGAARTWGR
ncbi:unnamed protein product, partial [Nesidiocoris tenuis]